MFKAKGKLFSLLTACLMAVLAVMLGFATLFAPTPVETATAATATETMSVTATTGTYSNSDQTVAWTGEHFTYTHNKGGSTSAILKTDASYFRVYASTNGTISTNNGELIKKIVITCTSSSYATACKNSFGSIATASSSTVTITPAGDVTSVSYSKATAHWRLNKIVVTYEEVASCDHANTETTYVYKNNKTHDVVVTCTNADCQEQVSKTNVACSVATWSKWTPNDGTHTKTGACSACNATITETATCEVNAEYTRNGNTHTQVGTCNVCGDTTEVTENCTLTVDGYAVLDTDDGEAQQHAITTTCSVCEKTETANEACSFDEGVLDGATLTHTCQHCEYSYSEELALYTVTYAVPTGITAPEAVEVAENFSTKLPALENSDKYSFVGWAETTLNERTDVAPTFYKAGTDYTVTEDITLYALYSYAEGSGAFTLVTDVAELEVDKEIVIVASASDYAIGNNQASNNRTAVAVSKNNDVVTWTTSVQVITLKAGATEGTWAFHVTGGTGTNASNGYLYAPANGNYLRTQTSITDNSSWNISITSAGVATIKANVASGQNWLRKNSSSALFACYTSGQNDVSIYMKSETAYYVTSFNACKHENTNEVIETATCMEAGLRTVTCLDCEEQLTAEILPATGHNFVNNVCENCSKLDPASIVYNGYYYLSLNGKYAGEKDGNYYKLFDFTPGETIEKNYVFYIVENGENYDIYNLSYGLFAENVRLETQNDYTVRIYNNEDKILSHNTSYTTYQRMGFYATSNSYPAAITLTELELAHIDGASLTVGENLKLNYKVTLSEAFADAVMYFTFGDKTVDVEGKLQNDGRYSFSLELPPQAMATAIKAELKYGEYVLATLENYSIQQYAQNKLNDSNSSTELKQLLTDMLYYGAAAQNYKNYNTDNLATSGVENLGSASTATPAAPATPATPVKNTEVSSYPVYFTGATVWFGDVNSISVNINSREGATLTVNGVEVELTSTTYTTAGLLPTELDTEFVFALYHDGVLMQTLTYSVNAYAYKMQNNTNMSELALALYRYGVSAKAYIN